MATTGTLVHRLPSANTITNTVSIQVSSARQSAQSHAPSSLSQAASSATSALPKLNLTPQKGSPASTPQKQTVSPAVSTPGQWQHPRMQEVIRRQNTTRFDSRNMRVVGLNAVLMLASVLLPAFAGTLVPRALISSTQPYFHYLIWLLRLFFLGNILLAFAPLFQPQDNCEDVPLSAAQRQLLGLAPMSRPATPQEQGQWVTPPRYSKSRSATPSSGNSLRAQPSGSPLSGRGPPLSGSQLRRSFSGSSLARPGSERGSPFDTSDVDAAGNSTPTKSNKASVPLNSKWLYEKGRGSPRNSFSGLSGFGGQGSVFS